MGFLDKAKNAINANKGKIDKTKITEGLGKAKGMIPKKNAGGTTTTTTGGVSTGTGTTQDPIRTID